MPIRYTHVDAFATDPFTGNPAGVCLLEEERPDEWMLNVAAETSLSETAFLLREGDAWRLRWFSATAEMDLCGHGTLATAHVMWETGLLANDEPARFLSRSGELRANRKGDAIELDFPEVHLSGIPTPEGLADVLRAEPLYCGRDKVDIMVRLASEDDVVNLKCDVRNLNPFAERVITVTAPAKTGGYDIVSRVFYPAGGGEDPVTGSAHCYLATHWRGILGRTQLRARQASPRSGDLAIRCADGRIFIAGKAVTVLQGELLI